MERGTSTAIRRILGELTATEGVVGSALMGYDGMVIAEQFVVEVNLEKIGALLSSVYNTLQRVFGDLEQGGVQEAWFQTERYGYLLHAVAAGLIVMVARQEMPLGLARLSMRRAIAHIHREEQRNELSR